MRSFCCCCWATLYLSGIKLPCSQRTPCLPTRSRASSRSIRDDASDEGASSLSLSFDFFSSLPSPAGAQLSSRTEPTLDLDLRSVSRTGGCGEKKRARSSNTRRIGRTTCQKQLEIGIAMRCLSCCKNREGLPKAQRMRGGGFEGKTQGKIETEC